MRRASEAPRFSKSWSHLPLLGVLNTLSALQRVISHPEEVDSAVTLALRVMDEVGYIFPDASAAKARGPTALSDILLQPYVFTMPEHGDPRQAAITQKALRRDNDLKAYKVLTMLLWVFTLKKEEFDYVKLLMNMPIWGSLFSESVVDLKKNAKLEALGTLCGDIGIFTKPARALHRRMLDGIDNIVDLVERGYTNAAGAIMRIGIVMNEHLLWPDTRVPFFQIMKLFAQIDEATEVMLIKRGIDVRWMLWFCQHSFEVAVIQDSEMSESCTPPPSYEEALMEVDPPSPPAVEDGDTEMEPQSLCSPLGRMMIKATPTAHNTIVMTYHKQLARRHPVHHHELLTAWGFNVKDVRADLHTELALAHVNEMTRKNKYLLMVQQLKTLSTRKKLWQKFQGMLNVSSVRVSDDPLDFGPLNDLFKAHS